MTISTKHGLAALIIAGGLLSVAAGQVGKQSRIELHIEGDTITWPQIWEAGFRPKHHIGMTKCMDRNVSLAIKFRDDDELLELGTGDVQFSILKGDVVYQLVFYGRSVVTLEEGAERIASFARVFGSSLTVSGSPPEALDSYGSVDTSTESDNSSAKFGKYRVIHAFGTTGKPKTPLLDRLTITLGSKSLREIGRRTSPITPPAGYEHISMELVLPKIPKQVKEEGDALYPPRKAQPADVEAPGEPKPERPSSLWWWIIVLAILSAIFFGWQRWQHSKNSS
jgi:hypothetical protein